jgi:lipoprotein-releasing system permease protein
MYHGLLTNRYLTTRVIPFIAVAAVALCVALVIIVVSVMTGFLDMVKDSGRKLMGDVIVAYPVKGIPYYEQLIDRIVALPEAAAATPVVDSWALLQMPYPDGPSKQTETVQLWGIEPSSFAAVTGYDQTLVWRQLTDEQRSWLFRDVVRAQWTQLLARLTPAQRNYLLSLNNRTGKPQDQVTLKEWFDIFYVLAHRPGILKESLDQQQWNWLIGHDARLVADEEVLTEGLTLSHGPDFEPAIVLGAHVSEANERLADGSYRPMRDGYWWMPRFDVTLTTVPIIEGASLDPEPHIFPVANEFVSGVFLIDDTRVMVPLSMAQQMLHLDQAEYVDDDGEVNGIDPAKATMVLVRAVDGVTPEQLRMAVENVYHTYRADILADGNARVLPPPYPDFGLSIKTWLEQQALFIGPIEKERELMRTLFSLVYLVCAGLVLSIFWAIVYEKTRDIGILRSIGASRIGITWIFLRYGLVIGIAGAFCGLGLAYLVVHNINAIHTALGDPPIWLAWLVGGLGLLALLLTIARGMSGRLVPIVLGIIVTVTLAVLAITILLLERAGGIVIWDPSVYYFSHIPNKLDMGAAIGTMIGAVLFSLLGSFLPAAKAADVDPVKALRYE